MQFIDSTNKTLQCATGQGIALPYTALDFTTVYVVNTQATGVERGPKCITGYLDNTFRNLLPSPTADYTEHDVKSIHVINTDSITHTLTFRVVDSGNARVIFKCTLQPNYSVAYYNDEGWKIFSSTGVALATASTNWGNIIGTLSDQSDLQSALNAKVSLTGIETLTNKRITPRTGSVISSATPTINTDNVDFYEITALAAAITSFTTNLSGTPTKGQPLWIAITDNGTAHSITWGPSFEASGTVSLPTTTVVSTRLDCRFVWNDVTSKWRIVGTA